MVLTSDIVHQYGVREEFARAKRTVVVLMFVALLLVSLVGGLILKKQQMNIIGAEILLGALGGYVSTFMRVYQSSIGVDAILSTRLLRSDWASIVARPILGAVFAVVLHLLFVGQLLTGGVIPPSTFCRMARHSTHRTSRIFSSGRFRVRTRSLV